MTLDDVKLKVYPLGIISSNLAWRIAAKLGKPAPYRGYAMDLENGQMLCALPDHQFEIKPLVK